ncbi:MAG TPA: helix-turn-helix transcriptional regulator [Polyangiaceae bacterium]|nr:helix-turn-helix transcriptional regulator [Polyangiaceae bacterium]
MSDLVAEIAAAACEAETADAYDARLFELLREAVGFDVGLCIRGDGPSRVAPGFDDRVRRAVTGSWSDYGGEFQPVAAAAARSGGVVVDRDVLGAKRLERTRIFQEIMRPHAGTSTLLAYVECRGVRSAIALGRRGGKFSARAVRTLERAHSVLAVSEYALSRHGRSDPLANLTRREREVVSYLRLGYTNRQIALACGTAERTVRNQLTSVFQKLGASSRAEVVARTFEREPPA